MPHLHPDIDPEGLDEFSVVFTDRSLNHMSQRFQGVMRDLSATLRQVYGAHQVAIVPGGGTFAMESVARQFGTGHAALRAIRPWQWPGPSGTNPSPPMRPLRSTKWWRKSMKHGPMRSLRPMWKHRPD